MRSPFPLRPLSFILIALAVGPALAGDPTTQPISAARNEIGALLRKWSAEGTAAGNAGDWYDNRDRGHSGLNLAPWPQIQKVEYSDEDRQTRRDWAAQTVLLNKVVFGNSSTSAGNATGGSNIRMYYVHPRGLPFLYAEYRGDNLYMYPEHVDHRPGHNGTPYWGDVYPTNTPYLIASQGSSGSDQPFMRAVPSTLAAFRPEVKKILVEKGLLMPTVQMILRTTNKQLKDPKEYLTGKAHPNVFDGAWVDDLKMVKMAHAITADTIPPMVLLRLVEEEDAIAGRDFFEERMIREKLADTPAVIARIFRAAARSRRFVVSAEESFDVNKRPLTYTWVVLQGDTTKIKITPRNPASSVAEIVVQYPERRPVQPGSALESNRVDIGVFVNNGAYNSPPGFLTVFGLDNESRAYDDGGRLLEIGYAMGESALTVSKWKELFDLLNGDADAGHLSVGLKLLKSRFTDSQRAILKVAGEEYAPVSTSVTTTEQLRVSAQAALDQADKESKPKAETALKAASLAHQTVVKQADDVLNKTRPGLDQPVRPLMESVLNELSADPTFYAAHPKIMPLLAGADGGKKATIAGDRKRLIALGIVKDQPGDALEFTPIRPGPSPVIERLTRYEKAQIQRFNADVIARLLLPGIITPIWRDNYVDPRLTAAKSWRDVYHYDAAGARTGWTRYDGDKPQEFDAQGRLALEKDADGHPSMFQPVSYERQRTSPFSLKCITPGGAEDPSHRR
ncbi:MAG TPA: hypothetical protein VG326_19740 [Tepidisphaeraceae bacterium]|jgi:hypothetical protein|nr:hypothetical protein [Tepidisphaeraceae bacterium]